MSTAPLLVELGWVVGGAALALLLTRRLRLPAVLVYLIAGLLLGPATGTLHPSESLDLLGEVGIALLLFLIGMELSPAALREVGRSALVVGGLQVALTTGMGVLAANALGMGGIEAMVFGLAVAFSSTVVVVRLLDRTGQITTRHGRLAVGVLLVQDVVVAVALTLMAGLAGGSDLAPGAVAVGIGRALLALALLVAIAVASARYLLPPLIRWLAGSGEGILVWSLTWCFLFIVGAERLHLSVELGAFIAGLTLAPTLVHAELRRRVQPLADLFLAIFFVILGAELEPRSAFEQLSTVVTLVALVMLAKPLVVALLTRYAAGHGRRTAALTAVTLGQMSEFSFILAATAVAAGLVSDELVSILGMAGLLTIALSSVLIQVQEGAWKRWAGWDAADADDAGPQPPTYSGHIVVVGINTLGRRLVEALQASGERVIAVDVDPFKLASVDSETMHGNVDHWSVLEAACVPRARLVVSALQIEDANSLLAYRCRALNVPVAVHAFDASVRPDLEALEVDYIMDSKREGARRLRDALIELDVLDQPE